MYPKFMYHRKFKRPEVEANVVRHGKYWRLVLSKEEFEGPLALV